MTKNGHNYFRCVILISVTRFILSGWPSSLYKIFSLILPNHNLLLPPSLSLFFLLPLPLSLPQGSVPVISLHSELLNKNSMSSSHPWLKILVFFSSFSFLFLPLVVANVPAVATPEYFLSPCGGLVLWVFFTGVLIRNLPRRCLSVCLHSPRVSLFGFRLRLVRVYIFRWRNVV